MALSRPSKFGPPPSRRGELNKYTFTKPSGSIAVFAVDNLQKGNELKSVFELQTLGLCDLESNFRHKNIRPNRNLTAQAFFVQQLFGRSPAYIDPLGVICFADSLLGELNEKINKSTRNLKLDLFKIRDLIFYNSIEINLAFKEEIKSIPAKYNQDSILEKILSSKVMQVLFFYSKLPHLLPEKTMISIADPLEIKKDEFFDKLTNDIIRLFGDDEDIILKADSGYSCGRGNLFVCTTHPEQMKDKLIEYYSSFRTVVLILIESICTGGKSKKNPAKTRTYRTLCSTTLEMLNLWKSAGEHTLTAYEDTMGSHRDPQTSYLVEGLKEITTTAGLVSHELIPEHKCKKHIQDFKTTFPGRAAGFIDIITSLEKIEFGTIWDKTPVFTGEEKNFRSPILLYHTQAVKNAVQALLDSILIVEMKAQYPFNKRKTETIRQYNILEKDRNWEKLTKAIIILIDSDLSDQEVALHIQEISQIDAKKATDACDKIIDHFEKLGLIVNAKNKYRAVKIAIETDQEKTFNKLFSPLVTMVPPYPRLKNIVIYLFENTKTDWLNCYVLNLISTNTLYDCIADYLSYGDPDKRMLNYFRFMKNLTPILVKAAGSPENGLQVLKSLNASLFIDKDIRLEMINTAMLTSDESFRREMIQFLLDSMGPHIQPLTNEEKLGLMKSAVLQQKPDILTLYLSKFSIDNRHTYVLLQLAVVKKNLRSLNILLDIFKPEGQEELIVLLDIESKTPDPSPLFPGIALAICQEIQDKYKLSPFDLLTRIKQGSKETNAKKLLLSVIHHQLTNILQKKNNYTHKDLIRLICQINKDHSKSHELQPFLPYKQEDKIFIYNFIKLLDRLLNGAKQGSLSQLLFPDGPPASSSLRTISVFPMPTDSSVIPEIIRPTKSNSKINNSE